MNRYDTSLQHILAELERIDLLLWLQIWKARHLQTANHSFQGLYLSEAEVDALLAKPIGMPHWATAPNVSVLPDTDIALEKITTDISQRKAESIRQGIVLRLERLARCFRLSQFEVDILLVCLAPELDLRYERLFAYLQDDLTKKRPSVDLVLNLLCPTFEQKLAALRQFAPNAPLFKHHFLTDFEDPGYQNPPIFGKYLKVDEPVVAYLLDLDRPDVRLAACLKTIVPRAEDEAQAMPHDLAQYLALWTDQPADGRLYPLFYYHGPGGVGKESAAAAVCRRLGSTLIVVDVTRLLELSEPSFETAVRLALRDALLRETAVCWTHFDHLLAEDKHQWRETLFAELTAHHGLVFLAGETAWQPSRGVYERPFLSIEFPFPTYPEREKLWHDLLDEAVHPDHQSALDEVANKFRFTARQIQDAALTARNLTLRRDPNGAPLLPADLYAACRLHSNRQLMTLARKISPHYQWQDITLPASQLQQLRELCATVKHRALVYHQWGFDDKLSLGKGLNALFAGPPGTGKTMAAEIIANELALDLYKIDLSTVISKYIGETEKNLSRIFAEASSSNAILFFDEADALFGKRSEVKDSHDRYANIEISYLLQEMEEYDGITLLATNLRQNMDDAFVRRMAFTIFFPLPGETDRLRIWRTIWPPRLPISEDLDLCFMARQFKLSGGNIKNIALASAFLAAENGMVVGMDHLIMATKRELQKSGKVCVKADFGPYYPLVEETS